MKIRYAGWYLAIILIVMGVTAQVSRAEANLAGTVKSSRGELLEGIAVSARADDKTITTTVYTNHKGEYSFPQLDPGHYRMWAQAVGFDVARSEVNLASSGVQRQSFSLKPIDDFSKQVSGSEWLASLPTATLEDRRNKAIFKNKCADCHSANFVLQNRFDRNGWKTILNLMTRVSYWGEVQGDRTKTSLTADEGGGAWSSVINAYSEDLADYLTKIRGPDSPLQPIKYPRLTGESLKIVVTEYDIPTSTGYISRHTGEIASEGPPSAYEGRSIHDAVVDREGIVWFGDDGVLEQSKRTLGKLDPETGEVTGYRLDLVNGEPVWNNGGTGIAVDPNTGHIWLGVSAGRLAASSGLKDIYKESDGGGTKDRRVRFDPRSETFKVFTPPDPNPGTFGAGADFDSRGGLWGWRTKGGLNRLDTRTGEWTEFKMGSRPYGIAVDANDNVWFAIWEENQIGFIDQKTGILSLINLPPLDIDYVTPADRSIAMRTGDISPLWNKGPRRIGADKNGDKVWFALYYAGRIASVDINTKEVKEYSLPSPDYTPYLVDVDKNHMVWVMCQNSDRILKFDPFTERFTEYQLPTLGTGPRHMYVDNNTSPPTIWVPYWRINKIARVQFPGTP